MLEGGTGQDGQGTAFDEITVGSIMLPTSSLLLTKLQHIIIDEVGVICEASLLILTS
jgi:hypothetical protein